MRIYELATEEHRTKLVKELNQIGYKQIGQGQDAMVFRKDTTHVIKYIFPVNVRELSDATKMFLVFYKFCKENPSPHLPIFSNVNEVEVDGETLLQISMENLYPLKNGSDDQYIVWGLSDLAFDKTPWYQTKERLNNDRFWGQDGKKPDLSNIENYRSLYLVMVSLARNIPKGILFDIHTENVMKRKDGTLVITDPWTV